MPTVNAAGPVQRRTHPAPAVRLAQAVVLLLLVGCEPPKHEAWTPGAPVAPRVVEARRQLDAPFVVFAEASLLIESLEVPVPIPVRVGSRPTSETLESDAPGTVSVASDGALVAHQEGQATIRAKTGGSTLAVTVRLATHRTPASASTLTKGPPRREAQLKSLQVLPGKARTRSGEFLSFQALTESGPVEARWSTSRERVLVQIQDHIFQAVTLGSAEVCASAAGLKSCSAVEVLP